MKRTKKHAFKYQDPTEKSTAKVVSPKIIKETAFPHETAVALADFKKAALIILLFIGLIFAIFLLREQLKIENLGDLLKL